MSAKPAWCIREPRCHHHDINGKDQLKRQRKPPLSATVDEVEAIVDPVRNHQSSKHCRELTADLPTTLGGSTDLCLNDGSH